MSGQGSPFASRPSRPPNVFGVRRLACALVAFVSLFFALANASLAAERTFRLRVAWGGGEPRQWHGAVSVTAGRIQAIAPLGIEADSPGSQWWTQQVVDRPASGVAWPQDAVRIAQRSPKAYDGMDLTV